MSRRFIALLLLIATVVQAQVTTETFGVKSSRDDAVENAVSGAVTVNGNSLLLSSNWVALRYEIGGGGAPFPLVVSKLNMQFNANAASSVPTTVNIYLEHTSNPFPFSTSAFNISRRVRSTAYVTWTIPAWSLGNPLASAQKSPDLSALIRENIFRFGPMQHRSFVFILIGSGSGSRSIAAFDATPIINNPANPLLSSEYTRAFICPPNSLTTRLGATFAECVCAPGYKQDLGSSTCVTDSSSSSSASSLEKWKVAVVVVAVLVFILLLGVAILYCMTRKKEGNKIAGETTMRQTNYNNQQQQQVDPQMVQAVYEQVYGSTVNGGGSYSLAATAGGTGFVANDDAFLLPHPNGTTVRAVVSAVPLQQTQAQQQVQHELAMLIPGQARASNYQRDNMGGNALSYPSLHLLPQQQQQQMRMLAKNDSTNSSSSSSCSSARLDEYGRTAMGLKLGGPKHTPTPFPAQTTTEFVMVPSLKDPLAPGSTIQGPTGIWE